MSTCHKLESPEKDSQLKKCLCQIALLGTSVGHFLDGRLVWDAQLTLGVTASGQVVLDYMQKAV